MALLCAQTGGSGRLRCRHRGTSAERRGLVDAKASRPHAAADGVALAQQRPPAARAVPADDLVDVVASSSANCAISMMHTAWRPATPTRRARAERRPDNP